MITYVLFIPLFCKPVVAQEIRTPCQKITCSPIGIDVPREVLENYSLIESIDRGVSNESFIQFKVRSKCPVISVKVILESNFMGRTDIILYANNKGGTVYEVPVSLPMQGHGEFFALQIVAVADSGETAAFTDIIMVPARVMGSGNWPQSKENWWAKKLRE